MHMLTKLHLLAGEDVATVCCFCDWTGDKGTSYARAELTLPCHSLFQNVSQLGDINREMELSRC